MRKFVPFVAVALFAAAPVQAQGIPANVCDIASTAGTAVNCTVGTTLSMTVPSIMELTLGGIAVSLNKPEGIADFDASGKVTTTTTGPSVDVRSNRAFKVQISSAANFSHTPVNLGGTYTKPAAELAWSVDGGNSSTPMTISPTTIGSGSATNASDTQTVTYLTSYDITKDKPGTYSLAVTFTLVAP